MEQTKPGATGFESGSGKKARRCGVTVRANRGTGSGPAGVASLSAMQIRASSPAVWGRVWAHPAPFLRAPARCVERTERTDRTEGASAGEINIFGPRSGVRLHPSERAGPGRRRPAALPLPVAAAYYALTQQGSPTDAFASLVDTFEALVHPLPGQTLSVVSHSNSPVRRSCFRCWRAMHQHGR